MTWRCPHCGAPLDEGILATFGEEFDCPECDQTVRMDELQASQAAPQQPHPESPVAHQEAAPAEEPISDTPPPGRLQCVQKDSQLILLILPGSNRAVRSLGCFAIFWLSMISFFTWMFLRMDLAAGNMPFPAGVFFLLVLSVFWIAGLVLLYCWLSGRFGKTYVLVEPDRAVVRHVLFGRERLREYPLDRTSHAKLVESYRQNDQPVYKIAITTASGAPASFGTFLSDEEKQWLVARINRHLGVPPLWGRKPPAHPGEKFDNRLHPQCF